jgi:hypothetical protein
MGDEHRKIHSLSLPHCFNKGRDTQQIKYQRCCGKDENHVPCKLKMQCGFHLEEHEIL